ncbi:hypothetical protein CLAIMM_15155 [Cladophialophora immunda]|nr:hypothetical protein CLAIMM_15155 [Cladophialophora immunda]
MVHSVEAPIVIVLGTGKNIGAHSVETFRSKGFRVAQCSRSMKESLDKDGTLFSLPCDLAKPTQVSDVFAKVRKTWGEPSVVIHNAFGWHPTKPMDTFSVSTEAYEADLAINNTSVFTFVFTANILNEGPIPGMLTLGTGKIASAHMVELGDQLFKDQNIRFFWVDERNDDGTPMFTGLGGQAHADLFVSLSDRTAGDVPWQVTFVAGKGYVEFPHEVILPADKSKYTIK